jgi:nanoRNase/pAp phosphatase (c-di-AMP/oligoRNAs hydrolase)
MRNLLIFLFAMSVFVWSIPKPMESIENYNVMLIHGAYGKEKGFLDISDTTKIKEAYAATKALDNGAALGRYYEKPDDKPRLLHWLTTKVFEEPEMDSEDVHPKYSYIYQWRSFSNPANSSYNNAFELGSRTWYMPATKYEHRRAMMEEAQEVKAIYISGKDTSYGQVALEIIRKDPDLYRQLASRYILIGHSMGGVVSREYVQGNFYNGDVDKIITLDSPHEGTRR